MLNLKNFIATKKINKVELYTKLGISRTTLYNWLDSNSQTKRKKIIDVINSISQDLNIVTMDEDSPQKAMQAMINNGENTNSGIANINANENTTINPTSLESTKTYEDLIKLIGVKYSNLTNDEIAQKIGISTKSYYNVKKGGEVGDNVGRAILNFVQRDFDAIIKDFGDKNHIQFLMKNGNNMNKPNMADENQGYLFDLLKLQKEKIKDLQERLSKYEQLDE